eukprot:6185203-Pleurochrysis_carterae.AAC.2
MLRSVPALRTTPKIVGWHEQTRSSRITGLRMLTLGATGKSWSPIRTVPMHKAQNHMRQTRCNVV